MRRVLTGAVFAGTSRVVRIAVVAIVINDHALRYGTEGDLVAHSVCELEPAASDAYGAVSRRLRLSSPRLALARSANINLFPIALRERPS